MILLIHGVTVGVCIYNQWIDCGDVPYVIQVMKEYGEKSSPCNKKENKIRVLAY